MKTCLSALAVLAVAGCASTEPAAPVVAEKLFVKVTSVNPGKPRAAQEKLPAQFYVSLAFVKGPGKTAADPANDLLGTPAAMLLDGEWGQIFVGETRKQLESTDASTFQEVTLLSDGYAARVRCTSANGGKCHLELAASVLHDGTVERECTKDLLVDTDAEQMLALDPR